MSERIVSTLIKNRIIQPEDREIYRYGLKQGAFMGLSFLTTLIISAAFNLVLEFLCFIVVFIPLRTYAGGYHSDSYVKCYFLSTAIIVVSMIAIRNIPFTLTTCLATALVASTGICRLSPMESRNKTLTKEERKAYKKRAQMFSILIMVAVFGFWSINQTVSISFMVAMMTVLMLMITEKSLSV